MIKRRDRGAMRRTYGSTLQLVLARRTRLFPSAAAFCGVLLLAVAALAEERPVHGGHCASAMAPGPARGDSQGRSTEPTATGAPLFDNLGGHGHPVTTDSPMAQRYFDQGLTLACGFNHAEAARSFREAARL